MLPEFYDINRILRATKTEKLVSGHAAWVCSLVITWYKNRHIGTGTSKTKQVYLNFLCFSCPSGEFAFQ